jgi:hypothetical protein
MKDAPQEDEPSERDKLRANLLVVYISHPVLPTH